MTDRRPLEMTQVQQTVNTVQGSGGVFLELNHIDLDPSWSLLLEVQKRQVCSLVYTSLWRVHWGKEESKSHNSLFLLYNDIMSCQSETKSLNITNRVNRRPHGIALQLPTSSNNRFIQEKDGGTMWVCVCVCIQGQGVTLAAHAINILQKQRKHFFFSSILTRKSLLKKRLKPINSLWGCTCRDLTVKTCSDDILTHSQKRTHT